MSSDIEGHTSPEQTICDLRFKLGERVKELNCLHRIDDLIDCSTTLDEVMQGTVELLPPAWQHVGIACARILYRGREFKTPNFLATRWMQTCDLHVFRRMEGCLEVGYVAEPPTEASGPFLEEEEALLRTIGKRLETVIERFRVMEALKQGFRFANSALDALSAHIAILDEYGTILFVNDMWRRFAQTNHPVPDKVCEGANYLEVCEQARGEDMAIARSFAAGIRAVARREQNSFSLEYSSCTRTVQRWYSASVTRFAADGAVRIVVAHEDITARKSAEQALRASESKFRSVIEQSHDGIVLTDSAGNVIEWNKRMELITRLPSDQAVGRPLWEVLFDLAPDEHKSQTEHGGLQARIQAFFQATPWTWPGRIHEMEIQRADGTRASFQASVHVIDTGASHLACAIVRDVTERKIAEESLRKLSSAVEQSPAMVVIANTEMLVEYVNPRFIEVTAYSPEEVVGQKLYQKRSGMNPDPFLESVQQNLSNGEDWRGERQSHKKNGELYWEHVSVTPIKNRLGQTTHYLEISDDVTLSRRTEEARHESETKLRAIFESSRDAIGVSRSGIHIIVNPAYVTMFGYSSADELVGRPILDLIAPSERSRIVENLRGRAAGEPVPLVYETRGMKKDGTEFDMGVRVSPYELLGERYTLVILRDITERKRADDALRTSRERYRTLVDDMPALVLRFQPNGSLTFINNSVCQYLGMTAEELIGTSMLRLLRPDDHAEIQRQLAVLNAANPIASFTYPLPGDGQETRWLRWTVRALCDHQGKVTECQALGEDITRDVEAQQALRKAKEEAEAAREREEQRYQEAERRREIAEGLGDVLAALNSDQPLSQILDLILQQAGQLLGSQAAAIYRLQENREWTLEAAEGLAEMGLAEFDLAWGQNALHQAVGKRQVVMVDDTLTSPEGKGRTPSKEERAEYGFRSLLAVPIFVQDKTYGGLLLYYSTPHNFSADEVELVLILNHQVALAIENARLHDEAERAAVTAERTRLARDLHDAVTQTLFSASITAEALPRVWERDPEEGRRGLEELQQLTRGALAEMRSLLLELRPAGIAEKPLGVLLQQLADAASSRTRVPISVTVEGDQCLSPEVQTALYRIAQEALNNVAKHAHATRVSMRLDCTSCDVLLEISDDGQGFDTNTRKPGKHGMGIMYERALSINAVLEIKSAPGIGTCISIHRQSPAEEQR